MVDRAGRPDERREDLASSGADDTAVGSPDHHHEKPVHGIGACRVSRCVPREAEVMDHARRWLLVDGLQKSVELINALPRSDVIELRSSAMVAERTGGG
jgi:hypothetical protein